MISLAELTLELPTYPVRPTTYLPALFDPWECYPYRSYHETESTPVLRSYRALALENDFLRATVVPDLGGRLFSLVSKQIGQEVLYRNDVVKPVRIRPRMAWISGGIEFNFPITHSPTSVDRVGWRVPEYHGRAAVQVGETERKYGLQWIVEYSLAEGEDFVTQRLFLRNPTAKPRPFTAWYNAAVRATPKTALVYPPGKVIRHSDAMETYDWPGSVRFWADIPGMTDVFWLSPETPDFGVFHHEEGFGLRHLAPAGECRSMKLWTYGTAGFRDWAALCTDDGRLYFEIQAGLQVDLLHPMATLAPGEERHAVDFWRPVLGRDEFSDHRLPEPDLQPPDLAWLGDDHIDEVRPWKAVLQAYRSKDPHALPRGIESLPPTSLDLEAALTWAATHDVGFLPHLGTYLSACGRYEEALAVLKGAHDPVCGYLRGLLLWKVRLDPQEAYQAWAKLPLTDVYFVCRRDELLAALGRTAERREALARADVADLRLVERQADILLAENRPREALALLESTRWNPVHERYLRTELWRRARRALGLPTAPVPLSLQEDNLRPLEEAVEWATESELL